MGHFVARARCGFGMSAGSLTYSGIAVLTAAVAACKLSSSNTTPPPWPMFHHDLQHTGRTTYLGPTSPDKKWDFEIGDAGPSSPAIDSDGTIYVGSNDHRLYALKPDGTKKWEFATGGKVQSSPAIASDGTIYFGSLDNKLYAVKPNGTKKWEFATGDVGDILSGHRLRRYDLLRKLGPKALRRHT